MRKESILVSVFVLTIATTAAAQTKFSGSQTCAKPDPSYTVAVGDRADHVISLSKDKCTWTRGEIAGIKLKTDVDTIISEDISATTSRDRGYAVTLMANGDTIFVELEGTTTIREVPVSGRGTWTFTGGTGKMQGIKGKGTYDGKYNRDGTGTFNVQGEYQLAAPAARGK